MSTKYTFSDSNLLHFVSFAVVDWIDVFTRIIYKEIVVDSLRHCQKKKGLELYGWVIMTNHLHMIISATANSLSNIMRDFKKHTSLQIKDAITNNPESRKEWMMERFTKAGKTNSNNDSFQFWEQDNHPLLLNNIEIAHQKLDYIPARLVIQAGTTTRLKLALFQYRKIIYIVVQEIITLQKRLA